MQQPRRKQDIIAIQEAEAKYRAIFESLTDVYYRIDMQGMVTEISPSVYQLGGYYPKDIIGRPTTDFYTNPQQREVFLSEVMKKGHVSDYELDMLTADGTLKTILINVKLDRDSTGNPTGIYGIMHDITKRKKEENRLKLQEAIITKATEAVVIAETGMAVTPKPRIIFVNDAFAAMTGYTKEEVIGKTLRMLEGPKTDKDTSKQVQAAIAGYRSCEVEMINYKKDGTTFWSNISISPVSDTEGHYSHWITIIRDITISKTQELEMDKAIINAHENEKKLIGMELHDNVNQILAGSLLALGMVKELSAKDAAWVKKSFEYIETAIDEIRKLSHLLTPNIIKGEILEASFESLLKSINANGRFQIKLHCDQCDQMTVNTDIQMNLYRILQEQLNNIIKYSNATSIDVTVMMVGSKISMQILDNGEGFDTTLVTGGIGLNNIKRRTESFSGSFALHSSPGKGCELVVEIPL